LRKAAAVVCIRQAYLEKHVPLIRSLLFLFTVSYLPNQFCWVCAGRQGGRLSFLPFMLMYFLCYCVFSYNDLFCFFFCVVCIPVSHSTIGCPLPVCTDFAPLLPRLLCVYQADPLDPTVYFGGLAKCCMCLIRFFFSTLYFRHFIPSVGAFF